MTTAELIALAKSIKEQTAALSALLEKAHPTDLRVTLSQKMAVTGEAGETTFPMMPGANSKLHSVEAVTSVDPTELE